MTAFARSLRIPLTAPQAKGLLQRYEGVLGACEALTGMAELTNFKRTAGRESSTDACSRRVGPSS